MSFAGFNYELDLCLEYLHSSNFSTRLYTTAICGNFTCTDFSIAFYEKSFVAFTNVATISVFTLMFTTSIQDLAFVDIYKQLASMTGNTMVYISMYRMT